MQSRSTTCWASQIVLESVEQMMQTQRLRPTGVYVPDAANDEGDHCHPLNIRAEMFSLRGATYKAADTARILGDKKADDFMSLRLHGPTLFYVAHHQMKVAAHCVELQVPWPGRTLPNYGYIDEAGNASGLCLQTIELYRPDEVLFSTIRSAADNLDATLTELEPLGLVSVPWQFKPKGWGLEDWVN